MKTTSSFGHVLKCFYRLRSPVSSNSCVRALHLSSVNGSNLRLKKDKSKTISDHYLSRIESNFYHRILEENPKYSRTILKPSYFSDLLANTPDTPLLLNEDLAQLSIDSVLPYTATLTRNLLNNKLDFSSPELIQFSAHITKCVKILRKDDIPKMLSLIYLWPVSNKLLHNSTNTLIHALDHACMICCVKTRNKPIEEVLLWMERWHWLGLCSSSEFVQVATGKMFWSADSAQHVLQLLFYMGELKTLPNHYDRPCIEKKVIRYFKHFNCDELGILAAGFFKSSTRLTNYVLYKQLLKRVVNDADKFHTISLNSVLKLLRVGMFVFQEEEDVVAVQKALTPLLPSLSVGCVVQTVMLGSPVEIFDHDLMISILNMLCQRIQELQEKDFRRIMYICAVGMSESDVSVFVRHMVDEIHRRKLPILHHFKGDMNPEIHEKLVSFVEAVLFLHILGCRSSELIASAIEIGNHIPDPKLSLAHHHLDVIVDLLFPDYSGPRVDKRVREKYHKYWFSGKTMSRAAKYWFSDEWRKTTEEMRTRLYFDVCDACGGSDYVASQTLLPLYEHKDLVVCLDKDGEFVPVPSELGDQPSWQCKLPVNSEDKTYCVLVLRRDRSKKGLPDHTQFQKFRETLLRNVGYRIAVVRCTVFEDIPKDEKNAYIREAIKLAK